MGVFGVIEAISEGIRKDLLEFLQLLNHGFYEHVERGCGEHDRDSDEPHAVVAVESVAEVEVDEGHVADWSNREGFGGGVAGGAVVAEMVDEAVGEATAVFV